MDTRQEELRLIALRIVKDKVGYEVIRIYEVDRHHPDDECDEYRLAYRQEGGIWSPVPEDTTHLAWVLFEELVDMTANFLSASAEMATYKYQLDKIEKQRAKWRDRKKKSRREANNPARYDPQQVSIYGEGHVEELVS